MAAAERKALAQSVFAQAREMGELVANVLEMTRLEAGAIALNRDWHAMAEIIGSVLRRLDSRLDTHPVAVDLPLELPLVRVDAALIEQVLANLIENAIKYTPRGTRIVLHLEQRAEALLVSVEDGGPGLPPGDPQQLFAKFYRGATESAVSGVGLGLAICRAIVQLHGGRIWAENRAGGGAAFRFTLPLEKAPEVPEEGAAPR
jgi:two-component system sensor histidine kinase KdpD